MPALYAAFANTFSTDLSMVEILSLMQFGLGLDASNVRASGITLRDLQSFTTEQGASVLVINDPARVRSVVDAIWDAPAMVDARRQNSSACQGIPSGAPAVASNDLVPTPTPAANVNAPEVDVLEILIPTPTVQATGTPDATVPDVTVPDANLSSGEAALPDTGGNDGS
jgi:hypothetical protein